jgi:hypothetical protein
MNNEQIAIIDVIIRDISQFYKAMLENLIKVIKERIK